MKFPRNARMLRSQLDAAPFAGVLFCLLIFILLCSLVYTPGVLIRLPTSTAQLTGVAGPKIAVALDANGNYYYETQIIPEAELVRRLKVEVSRNPEVTLIVAADRGVTTEQWVHAEDLAHSAGIQNIQQAVLPRPFDEPAKVKKSP